MSKVEPFLTIQLQRSIQNPDEHLRWSSLSIFAKVPVYILTNQIFIFRCITTLLFYVCELWSIYNVIMN